MFDALFIYFFAVYSGNLSFSIIKQLHIWYVKVMNLFYDNLFKVTGTT